MALKIARGPTSFLDPAFMLMADQENPEIYFENDKQCRDYQIKNDVILNIFRWTGNKALVNGLPSVAMKSDFWGGRMPA